MRQWEFLVIVLKNEYLHINLLLYKKTSILENFLFSCQLCSDSMHVCIIESSTLTLFSAPFHHQMADTDP